MFIRIKIAVEIRCYSLLKFEHLYFQVTWTFGDQAFIQSDSATQYDLPTVLKNGSLQIPVVHEDDQGLYTCTYERDGLADVAAAELLVGYHG